MNTVEFPTRPGIRAETLRAAGICFCGAPEPNSIEIPYHDLLGKPTGFCRWRLASERANGQKYHQEPDTGTRAYVPPQFRLLAPGGDLVIVEGEFKALALIEAGIKAIGLPSFNTYVRDERGGQQLLAGIKDAIAYTKPARILFLGDSDTATNFAFARNAQFLANALKPLPVLLPRIPINGRGKGIDDCREALGDGFTEFWQGLVESAEHFDLKAGPGALAARLLEREGEQVKTSVGTERDKLDRRIVRMAAECKEPLAKDRIVDFAERVLGYTRSAFKQAVQEAQRKRGREAEEERGASSNVAEPSTPNTWFKASFPKLAERHGEPVLEAQTKETELPRVVDVCEDFIAATLGEDGQPDVPTVFLTNEGRFYTYDPAEGVFVHRHEPELSARLSLMFLKCARACRQNCDVSRLEFGFRDTAALSGVLRRAQALLAVDRDFFNCDSTEFIAVANGMLSLADRKLSQFSPSYRRRNKLAVPYQSGARCPLFLDTLMRPALGEDDLNLIQRWCGLALLGVNVAQSILLLDGTAGGGKTTLVRVICGIIGERNVASLRTNLLDERFEIGRLLGHTLLYGADVPAGFLNQRSASVLKSLTGGNLVTAELKNSNEVPGLTCRFNVVVDSNVRLTVQLQGDTQAWRRRLKVVRYTRPKPERTIADLSERILREEASGVLNFALDGLDQLRANDWQLRLNDRQQRIVDDLLLESDGHRQFIRCCLVKDSAGTVLLSDAFAAYVDFCNDCGWAAITRNHFGKLVPDAVAQEHGIVVRHDTKDGSGKPQRGWRGLRLIRATGSSSAKVSEASERTAPGTISDTSDGLPPLHPMAETARPQPLFSL
jgi:P4 family phage/plasmid primase-like protien